MTALQRIAAAGIELPAPLPAFGQYVPAVRSGRDLYVGGHFGVRPDGTPYTGKVGSGVDVAGVDVAGVNVATARDAARSAAVNLLATVQDALGSLEAIEQVLHVYAVVNAAPDFTGHTQVIDAASDVLVEVLGEVGRHARLAVGVSSLPADLVLEITAVLRVKDETAR